MLKRLGALMIAPMVYGLVLLVLGAIAYRPIDPGPPPEIVLNGEVLVFPRDLYKLDEEQARMRVALDAMLSASSVAYPSDGEPRCPVPPPPFGGCETLK